MLLPQTAWKIVRDLGPSWAAKRIWLETQIRLGIVQRRLPIADWDFKSFDWLASGAPRCIDQFKASVRQQSKFFFDSGDLPKSIDADVIGQADRVLNGEWPYFAHIWFKVGFPPDWHLNPFDGARFDHHEHWTRIGASERRTSDIKFVWETSRFAVAYPLARAYAASLDERYAEGFWQLIEDWAAQNPPNRGVNWASGQEAAVRLMAWCFALYRLLESQSSTSERVFQLVRMIEKHGERIAGFIEYALSQHNNHGISEAVGLFTIGTLFPQLRRAAEWQVRGRELIIRQLREQVYDDGSYVQHSFNYQRVLIDNLLWLFRLGELNGCRFPDESYEIFGRAVAFMLRFCDSHTGRMPNFGGNDGSLTFPLSNCDYLDFRPSLQAAHYLLHHRPYFGDGPWNETTEWICAASKDRDVVHPERIEAEGKDARCCVSADTDSNARRSGYLKLQGSESSAMLRAAHYVDRPAQADQLHVDLWWRGENIACDAGTYLYNGAEPWTNAFAVTAVHNSVAIGYRDQMTRAGRFLWLDWAQAVWTRYPVGELGTAVEAWHNGYRRLGIVHKRAVLNIEDCWMIVDDLSGTFAGEARLHWLFPDHEFAWEQDECRLWMQTPAGPFQCCLHAPRDGSVSLARAGKVLAGGNNESRAQLEVRGWRSLYYGEKKPALSVAAECQAPTRFMTVLAPAEIVLTRMDEAGIRLRLGQREFVIVLNSRDTGRIFSAPQRITP